MNPRVTSESRRHDQFSTKEEGLLKKREK